MTDYILAQVVAAKLGVKTATLAKWRQQKRGPSGWIRYSGGDLGEWILRISDRDALGWLRGSVRLSDYFLSKVRAGESLTFYEADAMALLDDAETIESWGADTVAKIREELKFEDPVTQEKWFEACNEANLDDPPDVEYPTAAACWLIESLRKFVELEKATPDPVAGSAS